MSRPLHGFVALILTHGRPDEVVTYTTLRRAGYTGPIVIVLDDEDTTRGEYVARFGAEAVAVFDKKAVASEVDACDNFPIGPSALYARHAAFDIARRLGYRYFVELDDDYDGFVFRFDGSLQYRPRTVRSLDGIFSALVAFLDRSQAASVAIAQGGDFIGGEDCHLAGGVTLTRKAMNSFVCDVERPFQFAGRLNDDVTTYTRLSAAGSLFFTVNQVSLNQAQTQTKAGGITPAYLEAGTYVKSFYSVIAHPSGVSISMLRGRSHSRIHHRVAWNSTAPKIIREKWAKA